VFIHWRATPYREKFRLSAVGTAAQPVRVIGVPGPGGARPVINGENATSHPGDVWSTYGANQSDGDGGLIMVRRGPGRPFNEKPAFISIEGLEITRARPVHNYTFWDGSTRQMGGGIYVLGANDISILNCKIHDCSDGLFAKSNPTEESTTRRLLVKQCHIENCSENMAALGLTAAVHNIYTECFGITFEENYLGPTRIGSDGSNLKDRSSGTVIRYNWVEGGARNLDLVEADDSWPMVQADLAGGNLAYRSTQVYGNYFLSGPGQAVRPIHYGGDLGAPVQ
jgi:hypothetical protein